QSARTRFVPALLVEPRDRVGVGRPKPEPLEAHVVLAPAERARPMTRGERRRLVEEEELRELPGLHQRLSGPPAELESAGDPALAVVAPEDASLAVVQAAAVPVDESSRRVGDELAQRRHPVPERHLTSG